MYLDTHNTICCFYSATDSRSWNSNFDHFVALTASITQRVQILNPMRPNLTKRRVRLATNISQESSESELSDAASVRQIRPHRVQNLNPLSDACCKSYEMTKLEFHERESVTE